VEEILNLDPAALGIIILRTIGVYAALFIGLRLAGKRELGQMTTFDLIVILVISNAVQNAMVGSDSSLTGGIVAAFTLLTVNRLVNALGIRAQWLGNRFVGSPTTLLYNGTMYAENMRREEVTEDQLLQAAREHSLESLSDVRLAMLEVDGTISIVPRENGGQPDAKGGRRTRRRLRGRKPIG
jgi:uncharacterized membrane protein YcaP (DUF421 family)